MRVSRVFPSLAAVLLVLLAFASPVWATAGDFYARGTVYRAATYVGHANYFGSSSADLIVDINADGGDMNRSVFAPEAGTVEQVTWGYGGGWGNSIVWTSANGREKLHVAHLNEVTQTGAVSGGDLIARAGNTGKSSKDGADGGAHLHIERTYDGAIAPVYLSGQRIVPAYWYNGNPYTSAGPVTGPSAPTLSLVSGPTYSPGPYTTGQVFSAAFTLKNTGAQAGTWGIVYLGLRGPNGEIKDAATHDVTLAPGESQPLTLSRILDLAGIWTGWIGAERSGQWMELTSNPHLTFSVALSPATTTTTSSPTTSTTTTTSSPTTSTTLPPAQPSFADVDTTHPYFAAIQGIASRNIVVGYPEPDGSVAYRPQNPLFRAQFAKIVCGGFGLPVSEDLVAQFSDLGMDSPESLYPHDYVARAAEHGIILGTGPGTFSPYADLSRAQMVTMVVRAAQNLQPGLLAAPPAGYRGTFGDFSDAHQENMRLAEYNGLLSGLQGFGPLWSPWTATSRGEVAQVLWGIILAGSPGADEDG